MLADVGAAFRQVAAYLLDSNTLISRRKYQLDKYKQEIKDAGWMIKADRPPEPKAPSGTKRQE